MLRTLFLASGAIASLIFAMPVSQARDHSGAIGLYQHVIAEELGSPAFRSSLTSEHDLVTVRGVGQDTGRVKALIDSAGETRVFFYRMGTAVSKEAGDELMREHPPWVTRSQSGKVVTSRPGNYVLDITDPSVRDWIAQSVASSVSLGYDGVYLDVLGSFFSQSFYSDRPFIRGRPLSDAAWRDASVALINEVKKATGKPVVANGFGLQSGKNYEEHRPDSEKLIQASDGIQIEQFTRTGGMPLDRSKNESAWRADLEFLREMSRRNKLVLVNTRVKDSSDGAQLARVRQFALASFLLGVEGPALFQFSGKAAGDQANDLRRQISDLGAPEGPAENVGRAVRRSFANGAVAANPTNSAIAVSLAGESVNLEPKEGRVEIKGAVPSPSNEQVTDPEAARSGNNGEGAGFSPWIPAAAVVAAVLAGAFFAGRRSRRSGPPKS